MAERKRGKQWVRVGYGVHRPAAAADPLAAALLAWLPHLPGSAVFTGLTALQAHHLWLPPLPVDLPYFIAMGGRRGEVKARRPELVVSRHEKAPRRLTWKDVPIAPIPDALLACARWMGLLDLVVMVDCALHRGLATEAELLEVAGPRRKGAPRLREAVGLGDSRAESIWEGVLRMFHHAVGVAVIPQVTILDPSGYFVARADLLLEGTRTLHEYDGASHRTADGQRSDLGRDRALLAAGYRRRGYTSHDLIRHPGMMLAECDETLGRRHDPDRLLAWEALLRESCFTRAGQRRLMRRLGRAELVADGNRKVT